MYKRLKISVEVNSVYTLLFYCVSEDAFGLEKKLKRENKKEAQVVALRKYGRLCSGDIDFYQETDKLQSWSPDHK